jgi:hypothetical protein
MNSVGAMKQELADQLSRISFPKLLSTAECSDILTGFRAAPAWQVEGPLLTTDGMIPRNRRVLSETVFPHLFETARDLIEKRLHSDEQYVEAMHLNLSPLSCEHYREGDEFAYHCDKPYFLDERTLHFVLALNQDFEGGFTTLRFHPIEVRAVTGKAVAFPALYEYRCGKVFSGEKYVLVFDLC